MPESWNNIKEKIYNYLNNDRKQCLFDNFKAAEQLVKNQFNQKKSTPIYKKMAHMRFRGSRLVPVS